MARKTSEEKLQDLEKRLEQLNNQKKKLLAQQKDKERKARTHRLVEIGAEIESALGYTLDTKEARKALGDFLRSQEERGKWVTKAIEEATKNNSEM